MRFEFKIEISAPVSVVYNFFRDKHLHTQEQGSAVILIEKISPGPVNLGTQFREVVRVFPWYQMEIRSEVTGFEQGTRIAEKFWGPAMHGNLEYRLSVMGSGTTLVQLQDFYFEGVIRLLSPFIRPMLGYQLRSRLQGIKHILESEPVNP